MLLTIGIVDDEHGPFELVRVLDKQCPRAANGPVGPPNYGRRTHA